MISAVDVLGDWKNYDLNNFFLFARPFLDRLHSLDPEIITERTTSRRLACISRSVRRRPCSDEDRCFTSARKRAALLARRFKLFECVVNNAIVLKCHVSKSSPIGMEALSTYGNALTSECLQIVRINIILRSLLVIIIIISLGLRITIPVLMVNYSFFYFLY